MGDIGHCKHGTFNLMAGCPACIEVRRQGGIRPEQDEMEDGLNSEGLTLASQIVKVRYYSEQTGELSTREYTYYSVDRLKVGDIVMVPVRDTTGKAQVTAIDVPEAEISAFKDKVKTIPAGSRMAATIPEGKPGDEWKRIESLGQVISSGLYLVTEELRSEIERDINMSDGTVSAESRIDDKVVELAEQDRGYVIVAEEFPTAVVRIEPGKDLMVQQLLAEIMHIREWADKLVVSSEDQVKAATNDLSIMSKLKKAVEEKRQEYVGPLNTHVKAVNDAFKFLTGPLAEADKTARDKVTAYKVEQDRRRREAEETNRLAAEVARRQAASSGTGEFTVDVTPVAVPETPRLTRTDQGTSGLVDNWLYEVTDFKLLPDEYKVADEAMLNAIAKKHHDSKQVPGVRFFNKPGLRVSSK